MPIIAPINVLELFIRPLSLCMRLFGNVLGAVVVMALIKQLAPLVVPLPFSFYFDIFDGIIQAYVLYSLHRFISKKPLSKESESAYILTYILWKRRLSS